jgi:hypothetical protein
MTDPDLILPMIKDAEDRKKKNLLFLVDELEVVAALRRTIDKDDRLIKELYAELTALANADAQSMTSSTA